VRRLVGIAIALAVATGTAGGDAVAREPSLVRVRVIGIDRSGKTVPIAAWLVGANTRPVLVFSGHSAQVPPGRYYGRGAASAEQPTVAAE
jgi:hypothetical protein